MKYSILSVALSFLVFQIAADNHDDGFDDALDDDLWNATNATNATYWDWEAFEVLDLLIGENDTDIDYDTAFELDAGLYECDMDANNHGQFVKCGKNALNTVKNDLLDDDYKFIKKAIVQPFAALGQACVDIFFAAKAAGILARLRAQDFVRYLAVHVKAGAGRSANEVAEQLGHFRELCQLQNVARLAAILSFYPADFMKDHAQFLIQATVALLCYSGCSAQESMKMYHAETKARSFLANVSSKQSS